MTEIRMTVSRVWLPSEDAGRDLTHPVEAPAVAVELCAPLTTAVLCDDATLGADPGQGSGDPMELALPRAGQLAGLDRDG
jgi:Ca2+-transporting ATPase